jgi:hypothetical protein
VVEWLIGLPEIYDKANRMHKNGAYISRLWADKAEEGMEEKMLRTWYKSVRYQYTKVVKDQSKSGKAKDITKRDEWILKKFAFLKSHIKPKPAFCQGSKLKGANVDASDEEEDEDEEEDDGVSVLEVSAALPGV